MESRGISRRKASKYSDGNPEMSLTVKQGDQDQEILPPGGPYPRVSIILPVYNGSRYLRTCIDSIIGQRESDFELLIGDDRSTDRSSEIIASYRHPRVRWFQNEQNQGLFPNLNQLLHRAKGELIRFVCQDDILRRECLEHEIAFFDEHPSIGMSYCKASVIDEEGETVEKWRLSDLPDVLAPTFARACLYYYGCIPGNLSTVCVRRKTLEKVGLFDEGYRVSGDYELWTRICGQQPMGVIHRHLVSLRRHNKQLSRARSSGALFVKENRMIREKLFHRLRPSERRSAAWVSNFRFNVLDTHFLLRRLLMGQIRDGCAVARALGAGNLLTGLFCWAITLNNHLYRPEPNLDAGLN
jgi:glycosyltransferase involved in cell wall biosynthesis